MLPAAVLERAAGYLHEPGISVVADARAATGAAHIRAMHDPTQGGLATALAELATASGVALHIWPQRVPILPETELLCRHFGLDPLGHPRLWCTTARLCPDVVDSVVGALRDRGIGPVPLATLSRGPAPGSRPRDPATDARLRPGRGG